MKSYLFLTIRGSSCSVARLAGTVTLHLEWHTLLILWYYSGKSTQVPAFVLEDQLARGLPCKIYCTEPRRISAVPLVQRVSRELGDSAGAVGTSSSLVRYSIRLESNTTRNTRLAFVMNGIALRMLEGGTGPNGQGTAFDEITVSQTSIRVKTQLMLLAAHHHRRGLCRYLRSPSSLYVQLYRSMSAALSWTSFSLF
jgi:hypothetical protein